MSGFRMMWVSAVVLAAVGGFLLSSIPADAGYCSPFLNCWKDDKADPTGGTTCDDVGGFCKNRVCHCGESDPGICSDRCPDRGYCYPGTCGGGTIHISDCRGISTGALGGVISYCDQPACVPGAGSACTQCNACGMCNSGTIQCGGGCSVSAPAASLCGNPPVGNLDGADCAAARGWSSDPDFSGAVSVHIYTDGPAGVGTFAAALPAGDFYPGRGNVGFNWAIPQSLKNGVAHSIYAYAINVNAAGSPQGANPTLAGSPKSITCNDPPTGTLSAATCGTASGTAVDLQGTPVNVVIYNGPPPTSPVGSGNAGPNFTIPFTPFTDGQVHTLYATARDIPSGVYSPLTGTQAVACMPAVTLNAAPTTVSFAGSTTLSWSVSNAASCTASPNGWYNPATVAAGVGAGSGSSGPLTGTTTFTLTCTNAAGQSAVATKVVTVNAPPPTATITNVTDTNYCTTGPGMIIDWKYESVSRPISAYQVQVLQGATVVFDTGKVPKVAAAGSPPLGEDSEPSRISPWSVLRATIMDLFRWLVGSDAQACHGDCGGGGVGCAQACDEGGMASYGYCVDWAPANGYVTNFGNGKRNNNGNCGGWGNCTIRNCARDFGCNGGYVKHGGGGDDSNGPDGYCDLPAPTPPPCTPGSACTSSPNACGMTNGSRTCPSGCTPPANSLCPAPSCSANPTQVAVGAAVTATAASGVPIYNWNSGGGAPAVSSGNPRIFTYATAGAKTITVTDSNAKSGACAVTVCAANWNTTCSSVANGCGMVGSGTVQCNGSCNAVTPPNSACPPPSCSAGPASPNAGQLVTATGAAGIPPYTWSSSGIPAAGSGPSYTMTFASTGTKTITLTDSNAKSGACNVSVGAAYASTGTTTTAQGQPGTITFSTAYTIRVMVWDADDRASAWSAAFPYSTKPGPWPSADFTYTPAQPFAEIPVQFTDTSKNSPTGWIWTFGDGQTDPTQNPAHVYAATGKYSVTLQATNAAGSCSVTKTLDANKALPQYREVRPGSQTSPSPTEVRPLQTKTPTPSPFTQPGPPGGIQ